MATAHILLLKITCHEINKCIIVLNGYMQFNMKLVTVTLSMFFLISLDTIIISKGSNGSREKLHHVYTV